MSDVQPRAIGKAAVISTLGITQIMAWGSSYYLLTLLAQPISTDINLPLPWVVGGISFALLAAGLVSPWVGSSIQHYGGRPVLAVSSALLACGLAALSVSQGFTTYLVSWIIIGLGMASGLYDAAFSTVGRLYGASARSAISSITLFGGFASTAFWPLSALLLDQIGWRGTCLTYAALQLFLALPLHLAIVPTVRPLPAMSDDAPTTRPTTRRTHLTAPFLLLASIVTLAALIASVVSIHLITILQQRGVSLAEAVALGALIGPAQVGARIVERLVGQRHHPIWTMLTSCLLIASGLALLWLGLATAAVALIAYGAGNGIHSIARGAVPLVLFDPRDYARLMGVLALPSLLAQAIAPPMAALALTITDAHSLLLALGCVALINVAFAAGLLIVARPIAR